MKRLAIGAAIVMSLNVSAAMAADTDPVTGAVQGTAKAVETVAVGTKDAVVTTVTTSAQVVEKTAQTIAAAPQDASQKMSQYGITTGPASTSDSSSTGAAASQNFTPKNRTS